MRARYGKQHQCAWPWLCLKEHYSLCDVAFHRVVHHDSDLWANVQMFPPNGYSSSSSTRPFPRLHVHQPRDLWCRWQTRHMTSRTWRHLTALSLQKTELSLTGFYDDLLDNKWSHLLSFRPLQISWDGCWLRRHISEENCWSQLASGLKLTGELYCGYTEAITFMHARGKKCMHTQFNMNMQRHSQACTQQPTHTKAPQGKREMLMLQYVRVRGYQLQHSCSSRTLYPCHEPSPPGKPCILTDRIHFLSELQTEWTHCVSEWV